MGPDTRTLAGHPNCDLRWHLDSVPPDTPIRDIVDICRVWESHADADDWRVVKPTPEKARPVYAMSEPRLVLTNQVVAAVTGPLVGLSDLELEAMLKRLLMDLPAQAPPPRSSPTDIEAMLTQAPQPRLATARRDCSTILCISCGQYDHGVGRCLQLDFLSCCPDGQQKG